MAAAAPSFRNWRQKTPRKVIGLGGQVPRIASADPGHKGLSQELARRE